MPDEPIQAISPIETPNNTGEGTTSAPTAQNGLAGFDELNRFGSTLTAAGEARARIEQEIPAELQQEYLYALNQTVAAIASSQFTRAAGQIPEGPQREQLLDALRVNFNDRLKDIGFEAELNTTANNPEQYKALLATLQQAEINHPGLLDSNIVKELERAINVATFSPGAIVAPSILASAQGEAGKASAKDAEQLQASIAPVVFNLVGVFEALKVIPPHLRTMAAEAGADWSSSLQAMATPKNSANLFTYQTSADPDSDALAANLGYLNSPTGLPSQGIGGRGQQSLSA